MKGLNFLNLLKKIKITYLDYFLSIFKKKNIEFIINILKKKGKKFRSFKKYSKYIFNLHLYLNDIKKNWKLSLNEWMKLKNNIIEIKNIQVCENKFKIK
jgi:hypothetical protein